MSSKAAYLRGQHAKRMLDSETVILASSAVPASVGAVTTEAALAEIPIPAGTMGKNGVLRLHLTTAHSDSANNKTTRVRLGAIDGTVLANTVANTGTVPDSISLTVQNRNDVANQIAVNAFSGNTEAVSAAVNTAADTLLIITGQKANTADTLTLSRYIVEASQR